MVNAPAVQQTPLQLGRSHPGYSTLLREVNTVLQQMTDLLKREAKILERNDGSKRRQLRAP